MTREPDVTVQLHQIREAIYEEEKHLSPRERIERLRQESDACLRRTGLTLKRVSPSVRAIPD